LGMMFDESNPYNKSILYPFFLRVPSRVFAANLIIPLDIQVIFVYFCGMKGEYRGLSASTAYKDHKRFTQEIKSFQIPTQPAQTKQWRLKCPT
jgi:hypothetical protein